MEALAEVRSLMQRMPLNNWSVEHQMRILAESDYVQQRFTKVSQNRANLRFCQLEEFLLKLKDESVHQRSTQSKSLPRTLEQTTNHQGIHETPGQKAGLLNNWFIAAALLAIAALSCTPLLQRINDACLVCPRYTNLTDQLNAAVECLTEDYSPHVVPVLASVISDQQRAERAIQIALSSTSTVGPADTRADLLASLADIRRKEKKYAEAKRLLTEAYLLRSPEGQDHDGVTWLLSDLAKVEAEDGNLSKSEELYNRAIETQFVSLPSAIIVQSNLADLYRDLAAVKEKQQQPKEAEQLRKRISAISVALKENRISELEKPAIEAHQKKIQKEIDAETARDKQREVQRKIDKKEQESSLLEPPSQLVQSVRFKTLCDRETLLSTTPAAADGSFSQSFDIKSEIAECSPAGPIDKKLRFSRQFAGLLTTCADNTLFGYNAQLSSIANVKANGDIVSTECEPPETWWACEAVCRDSIRHRLVAMASSMSGTTFYEKPENGSGDWNAYASFKQRRSGEVLHGLLPGQSGEFYTFEEDRDGESYTAILKFDGDGNLRGRTPLSAPVEAGTGLHECQMIRAKNNMVLITPYVSVLIDLKSGKVHGKVSNEREEPS